METITSSQNTAVKEFKSLKSKKYREEKGLFFIEGIRFVEEALKENAQIINVLFSENFMNENSSQGLIAEFSERKIPFVILSDKLFNEISDTESPQGVLAVIRARKLTYEDVIKKDGIMLILDSIQDPGNMGTIVRTADAAGVAGIIMSKGCVDIYNPKVLRSTMGSVFRVPFCTSKDMTTIILDMKKKGISILAAHLKGSENYFDIPMNESVAIIVGNEANGISDEISALADILVKIPMLGRTESLNAAISASLLMYETVRQRLKSQ